MRRARAWPFVALLLLLVCAESAAHTRSTSYSSWEIEGRDARVRLRIAQLELTRLPWGTVSPPVLPAPLADYLTGALRLEAAGKPCALVSSPRALATAPGRALIEWRVRCAGAAALQVQSALLLEVAPGHLHFARVRIGEGAAIERVLSNAQRVWRLPEGAVDAAPTAVGASLGDYIEVGIWHIATGADHLVFLLALLLLAGSVREVVTIVTGFTVAHSITLALAAVGRIQPDGAAIEALIGLSIALVAAENVWTLTGRGVLLPRVVVLVLVGLALLAATGVGAVPAATFAGLALFCACYFRALARSARPTPLRVAIAFAFGLIHGFGFAGFLTELVLPRERLLPALLGFNAGVEIGQLAIVALAWPLLRALFSLGGGGEKRQRFVIEWGSSAICALGVFWLIQRAFA